MITECKTIAVDRAVFGSSNQGAIHGYQLLGWSCGIDSEVNKELCQWAPTRLSQTDSSDFQLPWLAHAFPLGGGRVGIGRTSVAGQEYSGRGGANVVTSFIILDSSQWSAYQYDAVGVLLCAMALGHSRIQNIPTRSNLSQIHLPATLPITSASFYGSEEQRYPANGLPDSQTLSQWARQIEQGKRLILVGLAKPIHVIAELVQRLKTGTRKNFSFSTGLPLSVHRPYQVHCLEEAAFRQQMALVGWLSDAVYETVVHGS